MTKTILSIGTYDTKNAELEFIQSCIEEQGGKIVTMDVSVLGDPEKPTDVSKHDVAEAGGMSIAEVIALGDENKAFQVMARGAARLVVEAWQAGRFDGMIALGGTMGTDLALDCAQALPLGVPKFIVSTVSFSPLIAPDRLAPDIQMILWAGGLYGLNSICKSSLAQAAGAVLGAAKAAQPPDTSRPLVGMTSLGSSCLKYMKILKPALEDRGFEVAVFHSTGMGGMAFESLARQGAFCCVMDFCLQEFGNMLAGSLVSSGNDRLINAGKRGIPQIVAPGALDLVDFAGWQQLPEAYADRPYHEHNRLIKSSVFTPDERRRWVHELANRLQSAQGEVHFLLPLEGIEEWDREGQEAHDPEGLQAFIDEARTVLPRNVPVTEVEGHINDQSFADAALAIFDDWVRQGVIKTA
ncbi:MAG: Tm-1-like ATP-binding domain-containing protein [Roseibium sp.]|uniref:Tm-1-like ATP-binding domain-containing protein n=1 Tax=Roseibium sp. TaxID=1936156 RepID=UPI0026128F31|nr:Tm-1-like ATP-binding domain-containing protein [Roseibium sp.]MCV0426156.1 Tm-1-like ATP-binding domain-containing protein [Roseibium sp.]